MARKSRKNVDKQKSVRIAPAKSQSGIYARLSVEDKNYGTGDSIQNQVAFLMEFVEGREDRLHYCKGFFAYGKELHRSRKLYGKNLSVPWGPSGCGQ